MIKLFLPLILIVASCSTSVLTADQIVDRAIEASGTSTLRNAKASFTFRNIKYEYNAQGGQFNYTRIQTDSLGNEIKDVLTNNGLTRRINSEEVEITEEKRVAYTSSVNSVIYFAFLPLWLNDAAVNKTKLGEVMIEGKNYYKIKITFDVQGGGEDYEDVFIYWFDTEDFSMDYLAYSYNEDDGKGMRFRVAYNSRKIDGVTIQDYKNLKPKNQENIELEQIDEAYKSGKLEQLSLIELEDVNIH